MANDFRGWLQKNNVSGALDYVGNDGKIDPTKGGYSAITYKGNVLTPSFGVNNAQTLKQVQSAVDQLYGMYEKSQGPALNAAPYGGGGGSAGTAQDMADEIAYWQDQMANADVQISRLGRQERTGERNIEKSFESAYDRLLGDKNRTNRDYTQKRGETIEDNVTAKSNIDTSVRNRNTAIQRLLGARGAGNSSAAQILAPYATAKTGSQQRTQVQNAFGRNLQGLDEAWGDYEADWTESEGDLKAQRKAQERELQSGIAETRAGLLEQKANAALQRAQAGGASYSEARKARAPYLQRINQLLNRIDSLGVNPVFTPKTAAYKAPELAQYTYDRYATPSYGNGVDPGMAQNAGAYWTLLGNSKKREEQAAL